jgi:LIVCS family branched-chain amino acid:cation transporter
MLSHAVEGGTIRAGFIAGGLLLAVYAMLSHAGAQTGAVYPGLATGAEVLTALAQSCSAGRALCLLRPFL